jgi:cysteine desulfurase
LTAVKRIYLDHGATTPVDERVVIAMTEIMLERFGNPSSIHSFGREARTVLDEAREAVASVIQARPEDIYFTSGGTEADNLALIGYALANRGPRNHIVVSAVEHSAVLMAGEELERLGFRVTRVAPDSRGEIGVDTLRDVLTPDTLLVSVMHANNEVGTINDIGALAEAAHQAGAVFHTDAVQSFGKISVSVRETGVDLLSLSGHKIYGPKGAGALFMREGLDIYPRQFGGHQETGVRTGTENLPGVAGLGRAAQIRSEEMAQDGMNLAYLREELWTRLSENLDKVSMNGHPTRRVPGNLNITIDGIEGEALLMALDLEGIAVSSGSACASGSTKPSHVLTAIGLDERQAHSSLRITLGKDNTIEDIHYTARVMIDAINRLRKMSGFQESSFNRPAYFTAS